MMYNPYNVPFYGNNYQAQNMNTGFNTGIPKVTGFDGAKAYQMGANETVALFDANDNIFWIKSTDSAGFASYRTFRYDEVNQADSRVDDAVTRDEFENLKKMVEKLQRDGD